MVIILILIACIILIVHKIRKDNREKYGYIKDGKVVFSNLIINRSYDKNSGFAVIEVKPAIGELNSIIISTDMLSRIEENDQFYSKTIGEIKRRGELPTRDDYNIQKVLELGIMKEEDSLLKYYSTVIGFKNEKKFIEFCNKCFELIEIDSKGV